MIYTETEAIERNNPACDEVLDYLDLTGRRYVVGRSGESYATWEVGEAGASFYGHYGFATHAEARADMVERAGVRDQRA